VGRSLVRVPLVRRVLVPMMRVRKMPMFVEQKARPHEGGVVRLKTPPHHVPSVLANAYSTAFRAAVEIAGSRNVTMEPRVVDASTIEYRGRWE